MSATPARLRLGIDAGGTFTDAVLLDEGDRVVASAKSLTTRFDLSEGIGHSIAKLPPEHLARVVLVSLSTTLTTTSAPIGNWGTDPPAIPCTGGSRRGASSAAKSAKAFSRPAT